MSSIAIFMAIVVFFLPIVYGSPGVDITIELTGSPGDTYELGSNVTLYARIKNTGDTTIGNGQAEAFFWVIHPSGGYIIDGYDTNSRDIAPQEIYVFESTWEIPLNEDYEGWYDVMVKLNVGGITLKNRTENDVFQAAETVTTATVTREVTQTVTRTVTQSPGTITATVTQPPVTQTVTRTVTQSPGTITATVTQPPITSTTTVTSTIPTTSTSMVTLPPTTQTTTSTIEKTTTLPAETFTTTTRTELSSILPFDMAILLGGAVIVAVVAGAVGFFAGKRISGRSR